MEVAGEGRDDEDNALRRAMRGVFLSPSSSELELSCGGSKPGGEMESSSCVYFDDVVRGAVESSSELLSSLGASNEGASESESVSRSEEVLRFLISSSSSICRLWLRVIGRSSLFASRARLEVLRRDFGDRLFREDLELLLVFLFFLPDEA